MPDQLQLRGGTTAQHTSFTGASKEVTVDTTKKTAVVHDGSTAGGNPLLREDGSNSALALGSQGTPSLKFTGDTNTGIYSPGADQLAISTGGSGRVFIGSTGTVNFTGGGTAGSAQAISFSGSAQPDTLVVSSSSRVGVGTSSPGAPLNVRYDNAGTTTVALFENQRSIAGSPDAAQIVVGARNYNNTVIRQNSDQGTNAIGGTLDTVIANTYGSPGAKLILATQSTARLTVDASGNVGIGSTAPLTTLECRGQFSVSNNSGSYWVLDRDDSDGRLKVLDSSTSTNEKLAIDTSGRLLVGTSAAYTQEVFGAVGFEPKVQVNGTAGDGISIVGWRNTANYPGNLWLARSNSDTIGTHALVADSQKLGEILFSGSDGTDFENAASIKCEVDGTPGANDMPGRLVFSVTADGASSPTERMRISNGGATGLFSNSTNDTLYISNQATAGTTYHFIRGYFEGAGVFSGYESFRVFTNGNVQNTNNSYAGISDIKLKENIVDANSQWNDLKGLRVRKYNFKEETGQPTHTQIGLIAQEAELVSPGLVYETPDRDADGNDLGTVTKSVNYSVLYMKAVKALQEAMERIEQLETEMAAVKAQLA